ncbi:MAG TPA: hypothetical protein PK022_09475 [Syntrophales bacterium]|nr:hypothetical protein [Syntrophales bacterium]
MERKVFLDGFAFFRKAYVMKKHYDSLQCHCPRLGHEVTFSYCRQEGGKIPCSRIVACWRRIFPVDTWLVNTLPPEKWERFCREDQQDKVTSLIDLIAKAKGGAE